MIQVFRHEVPVDDFPHVFALTGDPLQVDATRNPSVVEFWTIHDAGVVPVDRLFMVVGTGQPLPFPIRHWGVAFAAGGQLVWHLVEMSQADVGKLTDAGRRALRAVKP